MKNQSFKAMASSSNEARDGRDQRDTRDHRDILRFIYQTTAKGRGKSFQEWMSSWRVCLHESARVQANSTDGTLFIVINYYFAF